MTAGVRTVEETVRAAVGAVEDPELSGVTLDDLGLVRSVAVDVDDARVTVVLTPTFLGCSALSMIRADVERAVVAAGARSAVVRFEAGRQWSTDSITAQGRERLAAIGIAVPSRNGTSCPFCGGASLQSMMPVGAGTCRSAAWCDACRSVVEVMRDTAPHPPESLSRYVPVSICVPTKSS
jgi:ring-1,2-phenylacetyl-CoA epoxidase subunit PaaD